MIELLRDSEYADITVEQVIQRADVARATFYSHYADKDELFCDVVAELTSDLIARASAVAPIGSRVYAGAAVYALFRHAQTYPSVYLAMLHGAAGGAAIHDFRAALQVAYQGLVEAQQKALGAEERMPLDFIVQSWVGEHLALIGWWLEDEPPYSAADLTRMRLQLMMHGPLWARGISPEEMTFDEAQFDQLVAEDEAVAT
ncbi:MAG: TetR/AcrR family transcriptional regulator [Mycobacteriales bacterium]